MKVRFKTLSVILLISANGQTFAKKDTAPIKFNTGFTACTKTFQGNVAPLIMNEKLAKDTYPLCFTGFAVNYSGTTKTGLFSAEHITFDSLQLAKQMKREDNFHEESRIPEKHRALLTDYRGSGYDRGHLSPNMNRFNKIDQYESFSLTNIVPQAPKNNQERWRNLEEATKTTVTKTRGSAYIITGGLFLGSKLKTIGKGKVVIPTHMYKVVYFPSLNIAGAYVSVNDNNAQTDVVSVMQLQEYSGITYFPAFPNVELLKQRIDLPLTAADAFQLTTFRSFGTSKSDIFTKMPDEDALPTSTQNQKIDKSALNKKKQEHQQYIQNLSKILKDSEKAVRSFF